MKQIFLIIVLLVWGCSTAISQNKFYTKNARANFKGSKSKLEKIEAVNKAVVCVLDSETGKIQFSMFMKAFEFEKALMQEHFNENYVESAKYPKSEFKGEITNIHEINFTKNGTYNAKVKGTLGIHGEKKEIETQGNITIDNGKITIKSTFNILLSDFNISIPSISNDKISKTVRIDVDGTLEPLKQK